jgi:hypothetical protein
MLQEKKRKEEKKILQKEKKARGKTIFIKN